MQPNSLETADLVTFTEEILKENFIFYVFDNILNRYTKLVKRRGMLSR